jgi:hypothetical protein
MASLIMISHTNVWEGPEILVLLRIWRALGDLVLIDWLIDWCLTSSEQFFSYIQDDGDLVNIVETYINVDF